MITCYSCDLPIENGQRVILELGGEIVEGEFSQTQPDKLCHYNCDDALC